MLSQGTVGSDKPIAFASRTLNKSEEKYSAIEKELLAVVWACKYFRPYLYGRKFILYTDHKPLTYGLNLKDTNNRLVHWRLALSEFDYEIRYRPGKQNVVADSLSRIRNEININETESSDDISVHSADTDDSEFIPCTEHPLNKFSNQIILKVGPDETDTYEQIFPKIFRRTIIKTEFDETIILNMFKNFMDLRRTNCIYCPENLMNLIQTTYKNHFSRVKSFKICITQKILIDLITLEDQNLILEQTHNCAHRGTWENHKQISNRFFFPRMKQKISNFIKLCNICNKNKYDRHPYKIKLGSTPDPKKPLDIVHIDIFIKQPNIFLSFVDKFSRFGAVVPIKSRNITDVKKGLTKYFSIYGTPNLIVSDNEPAFKSIEIRTLMTNLNIKTHYTPPNHSESNGTVERFHSTLAEIFRCIKPSYMDLSDKEIFRIACTLYNNTIHSATKIKPREIFYALRDGEERPLDMNKIIEKRNEFYNEVALQITKTKNKNLEYHNQKREEPPRLHPNDTAYNKVQGVKNKSKEQYLPVIIREDKNRTIIDHNNREIHKENIKRKQK